MSLNDDTQTNINQKHELNKSTNYPQTIRKGPPLHFQMRIIFMEHLVQRVSVLVQFY